MCQSVNDLEYAIHELDQYKRNRDELLLAYVGERLNKSLQAYSEELNSSIKYLNTKKDIMVLKKLNNV